MLTFKKIKQILKLNGAIILVNFLVFSQVGMGLSLLGGSIFALAFAWTVVIISALVFFTGNNSLMKSVELHQLASGLKTLEDCINSLTSSLRIDTFRKHIRENINQIRRFQKKRDTINDVLLQKFSSDEMTYHKFDGVLTSVEDSVLINMRSILNKISAFDHEEYKRLQRGGIQNKLAEEKWKIYNEYITFVEQSTHDNEVILLKMDQMLLEISDYNSLADGDVLKLPAIAEMDNLIHQAKLYK